jgi:hypothetical protein
MGLKCNVLEFRDLYLDQLIESNFQLFLFRL